MRMKREYNTWLNMPLRIHRYRMKRSDAIAYFVEDGLVPFIESHGYLFSSPPSELTEIVTRNLFASRGLSHLESEWDCPTVNTEWKNGTDLYIEDKQHYSNKIDLKEWETFWNVWGSWRDVSLDSFRGSDRRLDIEHFVWGQLDLRISEQSYLLDEILNDEEEAQEYNQKHPNKRNEDIYLREAEGWGGYRK
jgi:hypothetical protein